MARGPENTNEAVAFPDKVRFLWVDPEDVMRDNPAALIVNRESYDSMEAHFSEIRFLASPPHVARVKIYTPNGEAERVFVVDGLTRSKFASDHKGKVLTEAPGMSFDKLRVIDITSEVLQDPRVVLMSEYQKDQQALTMLQYLRIVVPPTIVHSEIAADRIAGHLINAWEGMVGSDLVGRFPAISALSFVANDKIPIATEAEFKKALARQDKIIVDEQPQERERLEKALRDIAAIIRQSKLSRRDVEQSAYLLIGTGSCVIGGSQETQRQVHGLLRSAIFERKLNKEYTAKIGEAENVRLEFARALEEALRRLSGYMDSERSLSDIKRALDDESLSIDQTLQIVTAVSPSRKYGEIIRELNKRSLGEEYKKIVKRNNLTDTEQVLINNLGGQTHLYESKIPLMVRDIQFTLAILRQSYDWQEQLKTGLDDFIRRGVSETTINQAIAQMSQRQQALMTADSLGTLSERSKQLQKVVADFKEAVAREILMQDVGRVVDRVFEQELKISQDSRLKERIVWAAIHAEDVDVSKHAELQRWVRDLKNLDQDIQAEVIAGNMRMSAAARLQRNRTITNIQPTRLEIPIIPPVQDEVIAKIPNTPEATVPEPVSPQEMNRRRIERNIQRLSTEIVQAHLIPAIRLLAMLDLESKDVPDHIKRVLGEAEIAIEKLRSGHPDVVRVMDKDYPHSQDEITKLRETIVNLQREQADRDTRTKQ